MKTQRTRLLVALAFVVLLCFMSISQVKSQSPYLWNDDFNYTSENQFTSAGWTITQNPGGVSYSNGNLILDGTSADVSVAYSNHFPAGISEWTAETKSKWLGSGHSQPLVAVSTDRHGYTFAADGWYNVFALYRDGSKILTFGTYNEQVDVWVNMSMTLQRGSLYMYYNSQLEYVYNETDTTPQYATSVSMAGPWEGNEAFDYFTLKAQGASTLPTPAPTATSPPSTSSVTNTVWVPPPTSGAVAPLITVGAVAIATTMATVLSSSSVGGTGILQTITEKLQDLTPEAVKKWFEELISSKRKLKIDEKHGSSYLPTKSEIIVYLLAVIISTLSFAYVKVISLDQFLVILPTFFATSILVAVVRTYLLTLYARRKGVWTEYKLWYFGIGLFLITTFALKSPFSSPTRTVHHSHNFTEKLGGFLSLAAVLITLGFAGLFFALLESGFALVGGTGLAMCLISAFLDTFPIEPMSGKDIYKYNKVIWAAIFLITLALYAVWLMQAL